MDSELRFSLTSVFAIQYRGRLSPSTGNSRILRFLVAALPLATGPACLSAASRWASANALSAAAPQLLTASPSCWRKTEFRVNASGTYQTPFDAGQIALDAEIRSPSGRV